MFVAGNEVGGPEVASTLLGEPDHYTGEEFVTLDWKAWDRWICFELQQCYDLHQYLSLDQHRHEPLNEILFTGATTVESNAQLDSSFLSRDKKLDYIFRNKDLEDCCLYTFIQQYCFTSASNHENLIEFDRAHPLYQSNEEVCARAGVFERKRKAIVTMPWFNSTSTVHGIGTENFARIMLLLFKPFRKAPDLLESFSNFIDAFKAFKLGKNYSQPPMKYLYNIEYSAVASKEAQTAKIRDMVHIPSSLECFDDELLSLHEDKWIVIAPHLPEPGSNVEEVSAITA
ncbi:hypothetical protein HDV02_003083, partial [Globomyces sp. JEL0801]